MLKAIELIGFKSFADRTRLEFTEGISALVGPNGSGKSNIVDAIKWVLGEQSVKKLRGNDMTDVIFGGSGTRQALGAAEVTLSFDNASKVFDIDSPEVHITRRVYRSGESEYLINRQVSRLKNLKELLSGTGLGAQALSIIEQGRVQSLLESAPMQRRALFDEAAGVSRFNTKKQEAQRRLERVEQNLVRLSDIVNDIENRLKSTKSQAGKAQLYRQYTTRLQELRTQSSLIDWRKRNSECLANQSEIERLLAEESQTLESADTLEKSLAQKIAGIEEKDMLIRRLEGEIAAVSERILGEESTVDLQAAQIEEIETEIAHHGRQLIEMNLRSVDTEELMRRTEGDIHSARRFHGEISDSYRQSLELSVKLNTDFEQKQAALAAFARKIETENRQSSRITGEIAGLESRALSLESDLKRLEGRHIEAQKQSDELAASLREIQENCDIAIAARQKRQEMLEAAQKQKKGRTDELENFRKELSGYEHKRSGLVERISVLEELLRAHDGISPGVKEVIRQSKNPESPFRFAHGLLADLLRVDPEAASLIEIALGEAAQRVVVSPEPELFRHIEFHSKSLPGRVSFIWLDPSGVETSWMRNRGYEGRPGVLGRADRFVQTDPAFAHLVHRLLARTWIVQNIGIAKSLYKESDDHTNFLTVNGEYLASDGSLTVGPVTAGSGVITRRTELRSLNEQAHSLEGRIRESSLEVEVVQNRLAEDEKKLNENSWHLQKTANELDSVRLKRNTIEERHEQAKRLLEQRKDELTTLQSQLLAAKSDLETAVQRKSELVNLIAALENERGTAEREFDAIDAERKEHSRKTAGIHIDLAKSEERLSFLQDRIRQFEDRQRERQNLLSEHKRRHAALGERRDATELSILRIESNLASLYLRKEALVREAASLHTGRTQMVLVRTEIQSQLRKTQAELTKLRTKTHARQLELERLQQEQKTLIARIQEDYHIDLSEMDAEERRKAESLDVAEHLEGEFGSGATAGTETPLLPDDCRTEIEDLRQKIQKLGNVNLEAIETLEELETRFTTHSNQYQDLVNAKKTIEKIIEKTNNDSQTLFEETFEGVKHHFRELFQRFFGGGFADIVFEDPTNPLECGVDIVARPPGKELTSVSLMSGGEKTLTCVALLLAFFKYRPNPVCILDEVDAALDEGNIDRFVNVVSDFRTTTQFLIVTHSKKTMACAKTIYGITMQDSGVSKHISVRFVDVGENGEILAGPENQEAPEVFKLNSEQSEKNDAA